MFPQGIMIPQQAPAYIPMSAPDFQLQQFQQAQQPGLGMAQAMPLQGEAQVQAPINGNPFLQMALDGKTSVLGTDERQAQMGRISDKFLQQVENGESKGDRYQRGFTDVFGKLVAPAMAAFGGPGMGKAGVQLMQDARTQVQQSLNNRRQNQQNAMGFAKDIASMVSATSPYAPDTLASFARIASGEDKNDIARDRVGVQAHKALSDRMNTQSLVEHRKSQDFTSEQRRQDLKQYRTVGNQLKAAGLQFDYDKLDRLGEIEQFKAGLKLEGDKVRAKIQKYGIDQRTASELQKLTSTEKRFLQTESRLVAQVNAQLTQAGAQVDPKTGTFKFQGADGKQQQLPMLTPPSESVISDLDRLNTEAGMTANPEGLYDQADQYLKQFQETQSPQAPQAVQQMARPGYGDAFSQGTTTGALAQQSAMNQGGGAIAQQGTLQQPQAPAPIAPQMMQAGLAKLKERLGMYPNDHARILDGFARQTGQDPYKLLGIPRQVANGK